jgi:hypothetical protein
VRAKDIDDLSAVASDADDLLAKINDRLFREQVEALVAACASVHRAWSGSNIGYHANVYYQGLNRSQQTSNSAANGALWTDGRRINLILAG